MWEGGGGADSGFRGLGFRVSSNSPRPAVANIAVAERSGQSALQPLLKKRVQGLGFKGLGFEGLGFKGLGFTGLGFRVVWSLLLSLCLCMCVCVCAA